MDIQLLCHFQAISLEIGLAVKQLTNNLPFLAMLHNERILDVAPVGDDFIGTKAI